MTKHEKGFLGKFRTFFVFSPVCGVAAFKGVVAGKQKRRRGMKWKYGG